MDKIPSMNAVRLPQPARTPFEAADKSLYLAGLVDHFAGGNPPDSVGSMKVAFHEMEFEGTKVKLFRTEHVQPSTGLRAAASATAGVAGAALAWVAPSWGGALKNWSAETATQTEKIEFSRHLTTPSGEQVFESAYLTPPGRVEYRVHNSQGVSSQRGEWFS